MYIVTQVRSGGCTDIDDVKHAKQALRASRTLLETVIDSAPSLIYAYDRQFRFTLVNGAVERFVGRSRHDLLGRSPADALASTHSPSHRAVNERVLRTGEAEFVERVVECRDGRVAPTLAGCNVPLRDERGVMVDVAGIESDVTDARRLAAEVLQARKMESIGGLAGGVAHDFNNQLPVILGQSESALEQFDGADPA